MTKRLLNDIGTVEGADWHAGSAHGFGADIHCFDALPPQLETELDALYQHFNSSLKHFAFRARAQGARAYVARRDGRTLAIFLFHLEHGRITVLNEMVAIPAEEIERFARFAFARFSAASVIAFSLIGIDSGALSLPFQQHGHSEDIIVSLPASADAYLASLGPKTRHNIRHQMKAISRDRPELQFQTFENAGIRRQQLMDLFALKQSNTDRKGIAFGISPEEAEWMVHQAQAGGLLLVAMAGDKLCGGSLSLKLGDRYFAYVVAFEPGLGKYSLGMLCCYLAMLEKIARKGKQAHLSWGRQQYKFKLLGVQHDMANIDIYRSRMAYWRHAPGRAKHAAADYVDRCKRTLLDSEHRAGSLAAMVRTAIGAMRFVKRSRFRHRLKSQPPA
ncbi:GNAT family N-acetyltransferase [Massilia aerilata]|uniref:GNAT family N-acetyltransferase n=1 Tax=Massilia aerilata TaxID=453817 RepID=A0ABW0RXT1_9BURK